MSSGLFLLVRRVHVIIGAALLTAAGARAQLTPDRVYYGIDRPVPMTVKVPAGTGGEVSIQLLKPGTGEVVDSAAAAAGGVDLAALFPRLWKPEGSPQLYYAQLAVGGRKSGPAVVLQPMVNPKYAVTVPGGAKPWVWRDPPTPAYSGLRAYVDRRVVLETTAGDVEFLLRPDEAPNTSFNFLSLASGGYYTDIPFHRIADFFRKGQASIIQAGDPTTTGEGGPGFMIDLEDSKLPHEFGVISMARTPDPNSGGGQLFIVLDREAVVSLDGNYTTFAQAVTGADVLVKIGATPLDPETGKPVDPPRIKRARVVDAPPYAGVPAFLARPASEESPPR